MVSNWHPALFFALFLLLLAQLEAAVAAGETNATFDDTDPSWGWVGSWNANSANAPCSGCSAAPDPSQMYDSTWHDGSGTNGSFSFQGTAVYIYGADSWISGSLTFTLDNPPESGTHAVTLAAYDYDYRVLLFSATGLDASKPNVVRFGVTNAPGYPADYNFNVALLDYAIVTNEEQAQAPTTTPTHTVTTTTTQSPYYIKLNSLDCTLEQQSFLAIQYRFQFDVQWDHSLFYIQLGLQVRRNLSAAPSASAGNTTLTSHNLTSASQKQPVGAIAGGVVAGVVLVALAALLFCLYHRRHAKIRRGRDAESVAAPFMSEVPPRSPDSMSMSASATGPGTSISASASASSAALLSGPKSLHSGSPGHHGNVSGYTPMSTSSHSPQTSLSANHGPRTGPGSTSSWSRSDGRGQSAFSDTDEPPEYGQLFSSESGPGAASTSAAARPLPHFPGPHKS
ncbi:hypothetical protein HMN09_00677600 [Mycena chlorophos]|uniref:Uncharacterized protein n=1 Tax=Mycena chlorophos TaxID=658473 RepID=A0A8H6W9P9_MYCCL|nr:hypothetical protein HMN09_00677600 [Mycena chlorophos]